MTRWKFLALPIVAVAIAMPLVGCGYIADKDLIKIARFRDGYITRGDLDEVIRNMEPEERPQIRTKGDLLLTLEAYIDRRMKEEVADALVQENKIHVPRERAEQVYAAKHPDEVTNPQALLDMGLSESDVKILQQSREMGIDKEAKLLLGEAAVFYRIQEAMQAGVLEVTDEEIQSEYDLRKAELLNPEKVSFKGVYFPKEANKGPEMAEARKMLQAGAAYDDVVAYARSNGGDVLEATLQNDGQNPKFFSFWEWASGSEPGTIIGPIFLSGWERIRRDAQNNPVAERIPDAFLIAQVTERVEQTQKTLEEAREELTSYLMYTKMVKRLREEFNVEIYEDKLPDPSMYDTDENATNPRQM